MDTITTHPTVEIDLAGARITIPSATIAELWLNKLRSGEGIAAAAPLFPPRIGSVSDGETFVGIARGVDGADDYPVRVIAVAPEDMNWHEAKKWAESVGGSLPSRSELWLSKANVPELFGTWSYWSGEEYRGNVDCAWCQYFDYGYQGGCHKSLELRAFAVRRLPIQ